MKAFYYLIKALNANGRTRNSGKKKASKLGNVFSFLIYFLFFVVGISAQNISARVRRKAVVSADAFAAFGRLSWSCFVLFSFLFSVSICPNIYYQKNQDAFLYLPISGFRLFLAQMSLGIYYSSLFGGLSLRISRLAYSFLASLPAYSYLIAVLIGLAYLVLCPCLAFLFSSLFARLWKGKKGKVFRLVHATLFSLLSVVFLLVSLLIPSFVHGDLNQFFLLLDKELGGLLFLGRPLYWDLTGNILANRGTVILFAILFGLVYLFARVFFISRLEAEPKFKERQIPLAAVEKKREKAFSRSLSFNRQKRQWKNYLRDGSFLTRNRIRPALYLIGMVIFCFIFQGSDGESTQEATSIALLLYPVLSSFSGFSPILPLVSTSLEKDNFSIRKSMPLSAKRSCRYKLCPSLAINGLFSLISSLAFSLLSPLSVTYRIVFVLSMLAHFLFRERFCFFLGQVFVNFHYQNVVELNKGLGPFLAFLSFALLSFVPLFFGLISLFSGISYLGLLIYLPLSLCLSFVFYRLSCRKYSLLRQND